MYSTGIAHKLVDRYQMPVSEIADKIAMTVAESTATYQEKQVFSLLLEPTLYAVTVRATTAGLVLFELSDRAIAAWLNLMIHSLPQLSQSKKAPELRSHQDAETFTLQHTHARCCSLLRLADREGLITLNRDLAAQDPFSPDWRLTMPDAIPWLNAKMQLMLNHPAERQLISQLFMALDRVSCLSSSCPETVFRLAQEVSQAFQAFYRACPIWGSFRQSTQLAQAQLGLVMATRRIIYLLVADLLNIDLPLEL